MLSDIEAPPSGENIQTQIPTSHGLLTLRLYLERVIYDFLLAIYLSRVTDLSNNVTYQK